VRSQEALASALVRLDSRNESRRAAQAAKHGERAVKIVSRNEQVEEELSRFTQQRKFKAARHRQTQAKIAAEVTERSQVLRSLSTEKFVGASRAKQTLDEEREERHEQEWQLAETRHVKRTAQAARLQKQRKDFERVM
jgi:hypothetical protein